MPKTAKSTEEYYLSVSELLSDRPPNAFLDCEDCSWFLEVNGTRLVVDSDHEFFQIKLGRIRTEDI